MILRLKRISPDLPAEHARVLLLVSFDLELYLGGGQLGLAPPQNPGSYAARLLVPADNKRSQLVLLCMFGSESVAATSEDIELHIGLG